MVLRKLPDLKATIYKKGRAIENIFVLDPVNQNITDLIVTYLIVTWGVFFKKCLYPLRCVKA